MSSGPCRTASAVALVATVAVLAACSGAGTQPLVPVAAPATAPQPTTAPAGVVLPAAAVRALAVDPATRTLAVAVADGVLLSGLDGPGTASREVPLTGPATALTVAGDALLVAVPDAASLTEIGLPGGVPRETTGLGGPVRAAVSVGNRTVAALGGSVAVREADGAVRTIGGFAGAAQLVPVGDRVVVLDRARTSLTLLDPAAGEAGPALRVGDGATSAAGDRFGRTLVLDTREGELLVVAGDPLLLRQRYPVPGSPYGLAYDATRDLAWITLTARNEVVGLDVAGGAPVERYRFPTVQQPDSVAVDPRSGRLFVGSASGAGLQVIDPGQVTGDE